MTNIDIKDGNGEAQAIPFQLGFNVLEEIFEETCVSTHSWLTSMIFSLELEPLSYRSYHHDQLPKLSGGYDGSLPRVKNERLRHGVLVLGHLQYSTLARHLFIGAQIKYLLS